MPMKFVTATALCLVASNLALATLAHADSTYEPYYYDQSRDGHQFTTIAPAYENGVPVSAPIPPAAIIPDVELAQDALFRFNNTLSLSAGTTFFNYKEAVKPLPDSERGMLPTIGAGVDFMTHHNFYLALDGVDSFSTAHYNGALYDPATNVYDIPYSGTTHENIATLDGKIGQGFYAAHNVMLIPYVDVGYRYWNRKLSYIQTEKYHDFDVLGGLMLQVVPVERLLLSAYASGGTTLGGQMSTDGSSYQLGSAGMEKVGGKVAYDLTERFELFTTVDYDHFHFGKSSSDTVLINNQQFSSIEPGSRTEDTTFRVGIGYHFR